MNLIFATSTFLLLVLPQAVISAAFPAAAPEPVPAALITPRQAPTELEIRAKTEEIMFSYPIGQFQAAHAAKSPSWVEWPNINADACSNAPEYPGGFNFRKACQRHDFGFLNYRHQNRLCPDTRKKIDNQFDKDLSEYCSSRPWLKRKICRWYRDMYVAAIRAYSATYSAGCAKPGGGITGTGRDALGRCIPGKQCW